MRPATILEIQGRATEEGAPRSSGFNRAATSECRPAFSGSADPLDDDIPF
jgi:hypothetical protein